MSTTTETKCNWCGQRVQPLDVDTEQIKLVFSFGARYQQLDFCSRDCLCNWVEKNGRHFTMD